MASCRPIFSNALFQSRRALAHGVAILDGDRVFHPEDDRLGRPRQRRRRILFLEVPPGDVAPVRRVRRVGREVVGDRKEVAHAVVGKPRLEACVEGSSEMLYRKLKIMLRTSGRLRGGGGVGGGGAPGANRGGSGGRSAE